MENLGEEKTEELNSLEREIKGREEKGERHRVEVSAIKMWEERSRESEEDGGGKQRERGETYGPQMSVLKWTRGNTIGGVYFSFKKIKI